MESAFGKGHKLKLSLLQIPCQEYTLIHYLGDTYSKNEYEKRRRLSHQKYKSVKRFGLKCKITDMFSLKLKL